MLQLTATLLWMPYGFRKKWCIAQLLSSSPEEGFLGAGGGVDSPVAGLHRRRLEPGIERRDILQGCAKRRDCNSISTSEVDGGHSVTLAMAFARRAQSARPAGPQREQRVKFEAPPRSGSVNSAKRELAAPVQSRRGCRSANSLHARDVSFGPIPSSSRSVSRTAQAAPVEKDPKHRSRSTTPSNTRDRTPSTAASSAKTKSPSHGRDATPLAYREHRDFVQPVLGAAHCTWRFLDRGDRGSSKPVEPVPETSSFSRAKRFEDHHTQEPALVKVTSCTVKRAWVLLEMMFDLWLERCTDETQRFGVSFAKELWERSSRHPVNLSKPTWDRDGFAGRPASRRHQRGKRCLIGAPHTADTPEMTKLVCGSQELLRSWELKEQEYPGMEKIFDGCAGFSDQAADLDGPKAAGTRHFCGAPHVQDTPGLEKLICGSNKMSELKDLHEQSRPDLSNMFQGFAGHSAQDVDAKGGCVRSKRNFFGAPHVMDTPLSGILCGSEQLSEHYDRHHQKLGSHLQHMFAGHAGKSLQDEDLGDGENRRQGKREFAGAPHVVDSQDVFDLVCGSPTLKEAHAKKANPQLANIFDGCAGLCLQDEDVEGPRHRGKKKGPHGAAAYRGTVQQLGGTQDPDIIREIVISPVDSDPLPTLFVSHGLGPMPLLRDPSAPFPRSLAELPQRLRLDEHLVRCILVISAHWESRDGLEVTLRRTHAQGLLYDYAGASKEMYEVHHRYHPPGDPQVSGWVVDLLQEANQEIRVNSARALDHGVFVPLLLMPSLASVPVVQLSLPGFDGRRGSELARQCLEVGRALSPLRSRGVLILGSGLSTNSATKPERLERWTEELTRLCSASSEERFEGLRTWTSTLPHAREVHGREEHLLPLHVAAGAARDDPGEALCHCVEHGLVMSHFVFGWWRRTRHPPLETSQLPMDDDELMQCVAEQEPEATVLREPIKFKNGLVGIRGDYYSQGQLSSLHAKRGRAGGPLPEGWVSPGPLSPAALSTREPSCERSYASPRPDSRGSNSSDFSGSFRQTRGRMIFQRAQRSATPPLQEHEHLGSELPRPASRPGTPRGEDSSRSDKEVQKIIQAAKRRQLEEASLLGLEGVPSVSGPRLTANQRGFSSLSSARSRPQTAGRSAAQVPRPRAQGRNWRGVKRPPSASLEFERMEDSTEQRFLQSGPGPSRAHHLGCAAGHSTQYSCRSEVWWQKSPGADRRRQGDFEKCTLPSQQPSWESEVGYGAEEASGHWPSGRPRKAGDLPPLPGAEGGKAQSLGLFMVPPPEAPQPAWAKSIQPQEGGQASDKAQGAKPDQPEPARLGR
eukprot:s2710_g6.t1